MYLKHNTTTIETDSNQTITDLFADGYVFTRVGKGVMDQTRSIRVDLSLFELSSENRRILRKTEDLLLSVEPLPYLAYHWSIGKLAKDFYDTKFEPGTFSANKVKEVLTDDQKSNFTSLLTYKKEDTSIAYCITYINDKIMHYSYPFYDLQADKNTGMGMMLKALVYAKEQNLQYVYLGSAQRRTDSYKLQFKGLEWFDIDTGWTNDEGRLKEILKEL